MNNHKDFLVLKNNDGDWFASLIHTIVEKSNKISVYPFHKIEKALMLKYTQPKKIWFYSVYFKSKL